MDVTSSLGPVSFQTPKTKDGMEHKMEVVGSDLGSLDILSTVNNLEAGEQRNFKISDSISKRQKYLQT